MLDEKNKHVPTTPLWKPKQLNQEMIRSLCWFSVFHGSLVGNLGFSLLFEDEMVKNRHKNNTKSDCTFKLGKHSNLLWLPMLIWALDILFLWIMKMVASRYILRDWNQALETETRRVHRPLGVGSTRFIGDYDPKNREDTYQQGWNGIGLDFLGHFSHFSRFISIVLIRTRPWPVVYPACTEDSFCWIYRDPMSATRVLGFDRLIYTENFIHQESATGPGLSS